jgi:hypothetical protein
MGACTAFLYNRGRDVTAGRTTSLVIVTTLIAGTSLLFVALEGAICLVMALPLAIPLALLGGMVGRSCAMSGHGDPSPAMFMLLALPLTAAIEPGTGHTIHEVRSSVIIDAPPAAVWPHVVAFRDIPDPSDWVFRAGVAYPIRARIDGSGVGGVRYCVFSTGSFVEPITRWEPGRRLSFDVAGTRGVLADLQRRADSPHSPARARSHQAGGRTGLRVVRV